MEHVSREDVKRQREEEAAEASKRAAMNKDRKVLAQFKSEDGTVVGAPLELPHVSGGAGCGVGQGSGGAGGVAGALVAGCADPAAATCGRTFGRRS